MKKKHVGLILIVSVVLAGTGFIFSAKKPVLDRDLSGEDLSSAV